MPERTVTIASAHGLHARPASLFVQAVTASGLARTAHARATRRSTPRAFWASSLSALSTATDHACRRRGRCRCRSRLSRRTSDHGPRRMTTAAASSTLQGVGIGRGLAIGPVLRMPDPLPEPSDVPSALTPDAEKVRAAGALAAAAADIRLRGEKAGGSAKEVLDAQAFMAEDPTLKDDVEARIEGGETAERAVFEAFAQFRDLLTSMGGYMGERATDLDDVSQRVVAHLRGVAAPGVPDPDHPLRPGRSRPRAGGHGASQSRQGARADHERRRTDLPHRDPRAGEVDRRDRRSGERRVARGRRRGHRRRLDGGRHGPSDGVAALRGRGDPHSSSRTLPKRPSDPGALADGTAIPLLANLGAVDKLAAAVEKGAEGVGLFRTEFLFLDSESAPTRRRAAGRATRPCSRRSPA